MRFWLGGRSNAIWCTFILPQTNNQKFFLCSLLRLKLKSPRQRTIGNFLIGPTCNFCHILRHCCACACTNTHNVWNVFQEAWMPGIPFMLAGCQGCSWTWTCSCVRGDPEDNMAGPSTAGEPLVFILHLPQTHGCYTWFDACDILRSCPWRASIAIEKVIHSRFMFCCSDKSW